MTDSEINTIIAQAANDNPAIRMASSTVTSEESIADAQAAFLEALGESPNISNSTTEETITNEVANESLEVDENTTERSETETPEENTSESMTEDAPINNTLPENSASVYIDETTSRFSDAIWYNKIQEKIITLAGLGGIGSYVAFLLARMKPCALYLYDDDVVEAANMSGQLYGKTDVDHKKVEAMANMVRNYADYGSVFCMTEKFTKDSEASDIMICGFDNMRARYVFFHKWLEHICQKNVENRKHCLFIDGRLAAESMQVFCITGDDAYSQKRYSDKWLFSDEKADTTLCSYKQTTFCANLIGSLMTNLFVNFCANECNPLIPRDLPFFTSYEAETMYFKTEN